jgi:hypothetical protein
MKLKKELVDEVIRINKEYFRTGEVDLLPAMREDENALKQECKVNHYVVDLIGDIAMFSQRSGKGTYEDIYKALAIFGVIVE